MGFLFLLIKNFCDFVNLHFPLARISLYILPLELKFLVSYICSGLRLLGTLKS